MTNLSNIQEKLSSVQSELHAPKANRNDFANFDYRSAEDIEAAVKPLLTKKNLVLTITDDLVMIGERYYVKATAILMDGSQSITASAFAREQESKKGMDEAQVTGSASSYARKCALTALFLIDNEKDPDSMDNSQQPKNKEEKPWYNDFDKQKDLMVDKIGDGEAAEQILKSIQSKYRVSKEVQDKILNLGR